MGLPAGTCTSSGICGSYFVVESDGSVYPCDFYALDAWRIGSIDTSGFGMFSQDLKSKPFFENSLQNPVACAQCRFVELCNGGCSRDRYDVDGCRRNYFCLASKQFFEYAWSRLLNIAGSEFQRLRYAR